MYICMLYTCFSFYSRHVSNRDRRTFTHLQTCIKTHTHVYTYIHTLVCATACLSTFRYPNRHPVWRFQSPKSPPVPAEGPSSSMRCSCVSWGSGLLHHPGDQAIDGCWLLRSWLLSLWLLLLWCCYFPPTMNQ